MKTTVLHAETSVDLTQRVAIYKEDRLKARILFMNLGPIDIRRTIMFEFDDKDTKDNFSIITYRLRYNISKKNIMYSSEVKETIINCSNNKIMITHNERNRFGTKHLMWNEVDNLTKGILLIKYPQLRFLNDFLTDYNDTTSLLSVNTGCTIINNLSISSILKYKLYSAKKCLAHLYKTQWNIAFKLAKLHIDPRTWKVYSDYVIATKVPEKLSPLWTDLVKVARIMNRKVNISWSENRIKLTHDEWNKEMNLITVTATDRPLTIAPLFRECADTLNIELIQTTKELTEEAMNKRHCVGSYVSTIESGVSGIYKVEDYTLELVKANDTVRINQFRGLDNCNAPDRLFDLINQKITKFFPNSNHLIKNTTEQTLDLIF